MHWPFSVICTDRHRTTPCEGRVKDRNTGQRERFWMHCLLRAIPSVLPLFRCISFHSFLMSEWCEVTRRQRLYEEILNVKQSESASPSWSEIYVVPCSIGQMDNSKSTCLDCVLCLGEDVRSFGSKPKMGRPSGGLSIVRFFRRILGVDGEPMELEWSIFP